MLDFLTSSKLQPQLNHLVAFFVTVFVRAPTCDRQLPDICVGFIRVRQYSNTRNYFAAFLKVAFEQTVS